jgi:hypothetical protein
MLSTLFSDILLAPCCDLSWRTLMNFIIHFTFSEFVEALPKGCTVYCAAFTRTQLKEVTQFVILTSDAAIPNGTIHVVRLVIEAVEGNEHVAADSTLKFKKLMAFKDLTCRRGVLLTEGLTEALDLYGKTGITYSLKELDDMVTKEKEGKTE